MLLENKVAVIYGAGGAIGGAVALVFASEGAKVFLAGRTLAKLEVVAHDISSRGGSVEATQVDALDERAVEKHADAVAAKAGGTLLKRLPTLAEVANTAAFMASDRAGAITGAVTNLTCGGLLEAGHRGVNRHEAQLTVARHDKGEKQ